MAAPSCDALRADAWVPGCVVLGAIPEALRGTVFTVGPDWEDASHPAHLLDRPGVVTRITFPGGNACHVKARALGKQGDPDRAYHFTPNVGGTLGMLYGFAHNRGWVTSEVPRHHAHNYNISVVEPPAAQQGGGGRRAPHGAPPAPSSATPTARAQEPVIHVHSVVSPPVCLDPHSLTPFGCGGVLVRPAAAGGGGGAPTSASSSPGMVAWPKPLRVAGIRRDGAGASQMSAELRYTCGGQAAVHEVVIPPAGGVAVGGGVKVPGNTLPHTCLPTERHMILYACNGWSSEFINDAKSILRTSPAGLLRRTHAHPAFDAAAVPSANGYRSFNNIVMVPRASAPQQPVGRGSEATPKPPAAELLPVSGFVAKLLGVVQDGAGQTVVAAMVLRTDSEDCPTTDYLFAGLQGEDSVSALHPATRSGSAALRRRAPFELQLLVLSPGKPVNQIPMASYIMGCTLNTSRAVRPCRFVYSFSGMGVRKHDLVTKTDVEWSAADENLHGFTVVHILFVEAAGGTEARPEDDGFLIAQLHPLFFDAPSAHGYAAEDRQTHYAILAPGSAQIDMVALIKAPCLLPPPLGSVHTRRIFVPESRL